MYVTEYEFRSNPDDGYLLGHDAPKIAVTGGTPMYYQSIRGFIMGAVLGCALWLVAALVMFYMLGYQPRTLPYLWWSLGVLTIIAAAQFALTPLWERPAITLQHPRRF